MDFIYLSNIKNFMSLTKFLTSKTFLKQLALAILAIVVICFITLKMVEYYDQSWQFCGGSRSDRKIIVNGSN